MERWQLQQLQGLPLEVKIRKTQERIKEWYEHWQGQVYVSFSGGKDSTVLLHIARELYPDIEAVFVDTGLEYPEIRDFVKTYENVTWLKPKKNFKQVIEEYGYPVISKEIAQIVREAKIGLKKDDGSYRFRIEKLNGTYKTKEGKKSQYNIPQYKYLLEAPFEISEQCCEVMKKQPTKLYEKKTKNKAIIGTMATESRLREQRWLKYGCNAFKDKKRQTSNPLSFWTEQDIFQYILKKNISIAECYGEIIEGDQLPGQECLEGCMSHITTTKCKRTGCMFCMFGVHLEKDQNRFQMMKETHPKLYKYCIKDTYYIRKTKHEVIDGKIIIHKTNQLIKKKGLGLGKILGYIGVEY